MSRLTKAWIHEVEAGHPCSIETYARIATALSLRLDATLADPAQLHRAVDRRRSDDFVHAAMGELEAAHFRQLGIPVRLDEPYQHYQFAGRADLIAWRTNDSDLLHLENKTRFPNLQESLGSFTAKRAFLGSALANRLGVRAWRSETHVLVVAWTAEAVHTLRLRTETFRSTAPHDSEFFATWWTGERPAPGVRSILVVLDPIATGRRRLWVDLEDAIRTRPRHRGYADLAGALAGTQVRDTPIARIGAVLCR